MRMTKTHTIWYFIYIYYTQDGDEGAYHEAFYVATHIGYAISAYNSVQAPIQRLVPWLDKYDLLWIYSTCHNIPSGCPRFRGGILCADWSWIVHQVYPPLLQTLDEERQEERGLQARDIR